MAGVFGDLDLFSEFERDREAQGSFIHYDEETVRSRIVFEDYAEDDESASEDEGRNEEIKEASTSDAAENRKVHKREGKESDSLPSGVEDDGDIGEQSALDAKREASSTNGASASKKAFNISEQQLNVEDADRATAWLSEQLYADAAEEAKNISASTQQLIYEKNKYRRYAKILDSTRYVPDEDSPSVQLIFNNNSFARKYRQQIEQFIKSLLWEELNSAGQDAVSEICVKPGAPTCVDINGSLPPEKRVERMRQKHAIIGNSQFHKQFLIDFFGWPFTVPEPTRCNVNWEIPLYGQVFNEVYADPKNVSKKPHNKKHKSACWNCGEDNHAVNECKQPRNPAKISANRREFLAQQQSQGSFEPKFTGPSRYHLDPDLASAFSKFKPGVVSEALRQALGLTQDQLPQHIYKMRLYGYPPGWLAEARQIQSGVTIFDKNGRVTLITGECLEDGELQEEEAVEKKTEYDVGKIIEYPGFTVPVPLGFMDEHSVYMMPPIQQHQLKKTLMTQNTDKTSSKKRKRGKDRDNKDVKKAKTEEPKPEDGEIAEEGEENGMEVGKEENSEETTESSSIVAAASPSMEFLEAKLDLPRSSSTISLSRDFGTPVLTRENSGLPDAAKFGQGIEEHIPFENLPNSTGTFEKMRNLIDIIRNKSKK